MISTTLRDGVERWLGRSVERLERPAPGWSCETVIVDGEVVLRLPPLGEGAFPVYDLAQQAAVQAAVAAAGVPVATGLRYEPDPGYLGVAFVAMDFVAGAIPDQFTAADPWLAELPDDAARRTVWASFVDALASINAVDFDGLGLRTGLDAELAWWTEYVEWAADGSPPAALREVVAWCAANRPTDDATGRVPVGRRAARQRDLRPRDLPAEGRPRLGHGVGRTGRDGPRVVPRARRACRPR